MRHLLAAFPCRGYTSVNRTIWPSKDDNDVPFQALTQALIFASQVATSLVPVDTAICNENCNQRFASRCSCRMGRRRASPHPGNPCGGPPSRRLHQHSACGCRHRLPLPVVAHSFYEQTKRLARVSRLSDGSAGRVSETDGPAVCRAPGVIAASLEPSSHPLRAISAPMWSMVIDVDRIRHWRHLTTLCWTLGLLHCDVVVASVHFGG